MEITIEEKKRFLKENNLTHLVRELAEYEGSEYAINYVYDAHTISRDEFRKKYWGC